jgi:hypothetical protein
MDWSPDLTYKCFGAYFPDVKAMVYDLSKAVIVERKGREDDVDTMNEDNEQ